MSLDIVNFQTAATLLGWDQVINQAKSLQSTLGALPGTTIYQLGARITSTFDAFGQITSARSTSSRGPLSVKIASSGNNAASSANIFDLSVSQNGLAERTQSTLDPVIMATSALFLNWNTFGNTNTFGTGSSANVSDKLGLYLTGSYRSPVFSIALPDYQSSQTNMDMYGYDAQMSYLPYSVADFHVSTTQIGALAASDIQSVAFNASSMSGSTAQPSPFTHVTLTLKVASKTNEFVVGNVVTFGNFSPWYWNAKYVVNGIDSVAGVLYLSPRDASPLCSYANGNTLASMRITFTSVPVEGATIKLGGETFEFTYLAQAGGAEYTNKILLTSVTTVAQLASVVSAALFSNSPDAASRAGRVDKLKGCICQYTSGNAYFDLLDVSNTNFSAADFSGGWGGVTFGNYVNGVQNFTPVDVTPTTLGNIATVEFRRFGIGYHGQPILFPTASVARWSDYTTNAFAGQLFNWREGYSAAGAGYGFYLANGKSFQKIGDGAYAMSISASQTVPNSTGSSVQDGMDISSCRSLQITATTTGLTVTIPAGASHNPYNGQRLRIINPGTNQFTIAYSGVKTVGGAALAVPGKSSIEFEFVKSAGAWFQVSSVLTVA